MSNCPSRSAGARDGDEDAFGGRRSLGAAPSISDGVIDVLIARADGVPLYVEELTKAVAEPGAARGADAIPSPLAASLMARLDRLSAAKEVAQRAAVLGREFGYSCWPPSARSKTRASARGSRGLVDAEIVFHAASRPGDVRSSTRSCRRRRTSRYSSARTSSSTDVARLWRDQGKHAEARDLLAPVYGWFTEGLATRDLLMRTHSWKTCDDGLVDSGDCGSSSVPIPPQSGGGPELDRGLTERL